MISAAEALQLPGAQLSVEEVQAVSDLLYEIDAFVKRNMKRSGCAFFTKEKRANVIVEVDSRLRDPSLGYSTQWEAQAEVSTFAPESAPIHVGYRLILKASDEAVSDVRKSQLS